MVGLQAGDVTSAPLEDVVSSQKELDPGLFEISRIMER
jgi:hypothetical protein